MRLSVATYNVHGCVGRDARFAPARTLEVLRELGADVIALQELRWNPSEALHLLEEFGQRLGYTAIAGPTLLSGEGHYGNALLTRFAPRATARIDLSLPGREARGALDVQVDAGGTALRVIATHLGLQPGERRAQMRQLLGRIEGRASVPLILLGDLNEWLLWGRPLRWLRRHFGRTAAPATYPSGLPLFALDRIWAAPKGMLGEVRAHRSPLAHMASDHLPLRAELRLPAR